MKAVKILLAMGNESLIFKVKSVLQEQGYSISCIVTDGYECLRKARAHRVDLAIIDFDISSVSGYKVSEILANDGVCDVILIVNSIQKGIVGNLGDREEITILTKPINKEIFLYTVNILAKSRNRTKALKEEINSLRETLEERKVVERAKGLLIKHLKIDEEEAFKMMRKESMDSRKSLKDVAYNIIEKYS